MSAPDRASCLGVTGHRRLPAADPGLLHARLGEVLAAVARVSPQRPPWLASSLAEGADRLAAEAALDLGYRVWCPLPFEAAEYERDFEDEESLAVFRRLLARATLVTTCPSPPGATREAGYLAAGREVLAGSRALLALWDGLPARGEGGTGQVVAEALALGLPVLWLSAGAPHALRLRRAGSEWQDATAASLESDRGWLR